MFNDKNHGFTSKHVQTKHPRVFTFRIGVFWCETNNLFFSEINNSPFSNYTANAKISLSCRVEGRGCLNRKFDLTPWLELDENNSCLSEQSSDYAFSQHKCWERIALKPVCKKRCEILVRIFAYNIRVGFLFFFYVIIIYFRIASLHRGGLDLENATEQSLPNDSSLVIDFLQSLSLFFEFTKDIWQAWCILWNKKW